MYNTFSLKFSQTKGKATQQHISAKQPACSFTGASQVQPLCAAHGPMVYHLLPYSRAPFINLPQQPVPFPLNHRITHVSNAVCHHQVKHM